jgi:hypothetical protein
MSPPVRAGQPSVSCGTHEPEPGAPEFCLGGEASQRPVGMALVVVQAAAGQFAQRHAGGQFPAGVNEPAEHPERQ